MVKQPLQVHLVHIAGKSVNGILTRCLGKTLGVPIHRRAESPGEQPEERRLGLDRADQDQFGIGG